MARTYWTVEKWTNGVWVADNSIYKPNESLSIDLTSTQSKVQMSDGSFAFFTPEKYYTREPLTFQWFQIVPTDTFVTNITNHIKLGNYLRLTDANGDTYTGKFISLRRVWIIGEDKAIDLEAVFENMVN